MLDAKEKYLNEIVPELQKDLGYSNSMQVPRVQKITLNMGVGEAMADKKAIEKAQNDLEKIIGQKPIITKTKKSVAVEIPLRSSTTSSCALSSSARSRARVTSVGKSTAKTSKVFGRLRRT